MDRTFRVACTCERKLKTCYFLGGRTWEQFVAVGEIVARDDFDFAEGDPKDDFAPEKAGPMTFKYYTTDGVRHTVRIGVTGREYRHYAEETSPAELARTARRVQSRRKRPKAMASSRRETTPRMAGKTPE